MLPAANRMRRSADFASVLRHGRRAGASTLVIHHGRGLRADDPPLVGLLVGRSVGNSVVRHRVSRRLRAQLTQRLELLPDGSATVVRALPAAASASSVELGRDLDRLLRRVLTDPALAPPAGAAAGRPG